LLDDYVEYLRGLGVTIVVGRRTDDYVRFVITDITTEAERKKTKTELQKLDEKAFIQMNWDAYDSVAGIAACEGLKEVAGEAVIDTKLKTITVAKIRTGLMWMSMPHARSPVTFHTHPMARYRGAAAEPPSEGDLILVVTNFAHRGLVWHFVTAPEGTYILCPSDMLAAQYEKDPAHTLEVMNEIYARRIRCVGSVEVCVLTAVRALREAGFVVHFRPHPCSQLGAAPNLVPLQNADIRREARADLAQHLELTGSELVAANWDSAIAMCVGLPTEIPGAWLRARYTAGVIQPIDGHRFGNPSLESSYPGGSTPGPIIAFFFPNGIPARIPQAALTIARHRAGVWPWMAFFSASQITVFRVDSAGNADVYGPHSFKARAAA
jgi:hypothetical protein